MSRQTRGRIRLLTAGFVAVMLGLAVWRYFAIPAPIRQYDGATAEVTLEAAGFTSDAPYGKQAAVRLNGVSGILYYTGPAEIKPGDRLTGAFRITLAPRSGSHFKATIYQDFTVEAGSPRLWDRPAYWGEAVKGRIQEVFSGDGAALLTGILTGDRGGFSDRLTEDLFTSGMTHVAAVSGLHVSILAGFAALVTRSRRRSFVIALPMVLLYVAITGFTPSAVRAGIMIAIAIIAPLIGREYTSLRALVAAFLILCVMNPYAVFEPSMQLSFSAALGLILFASKWQTALYARLEKTPIPKRAGKLLASSLAASFAALVFSTPFAAYWFGGASLIAPFANLLLLWLVSVIFIGGVAALLIPALAFVPGAALSAFRAAIGLLGRTPYAVLYTSQPYMLAWLVYLYALFVILLLTAGLPTRRWKSPFVLAVSSLALCLALTVWRDGRFRLEIAALDVGQGQCIVIRSGGQTAVYDCGGNANAGRAAARYLQSRGVRHVDYLLLSHYDTDHINGVPTLLEVAGAGSILGPGLDNLPSGYPVETVTEEYTFTLGLAEIKLIPTRWLGQNNEQCMSALVTLDGFSFLVTGDLGHSSERWLTRWEALPQGGVLIAGHHGSAGSTSQELLDALNPQAAIISVGNNRYGHPSGETFDRLLDSGAAIYRTDRQGTVTIRY